MGPKSTNDYKTYYDKANKEVENNNTDLAIEYYKRSLNLKDNNVECLTKLGNLYEKLNRIKDAIKCYIKILSIETNIINRCIITNQIGVCYSNIQKYDKAIEYFEKILKYKNDIPDIYNNIGFCYLKLKNFKECEVNYFNSLRLKKDNNVYTELGKMYAYIKKYELSIKFYEKVDDYQTNIKVRYNCAFAHLGQKNFVEGFKLYENRLQINDICEQTKLQQRVEIPQIDFWDGKTVCNNLLIIYEQGIGDNIQYYRYLVELAELYPDMNIFYFCKDIVHKIFKEYDNLHIIQSVTFMNYNYKLYIMSLPYILQINTITPNVKNYINVNNDRVEYYKNELSHLKKYRIGITYYGLLESIIDKNIPLSEFSILFDNPNIDFICIHRLSEVSEEYKTNLKDKITFLDIDKDVPFQDTIALLHNIDLLITIDTFIVHLAGVLNVKTWLLLGYVSDWRWFKDDISSWYNSVEILRIKESKQLKYILPVVKEKLDNMDLKCSN